MANNYNIAVIGGGPAGLMAAAAAAESGALVVLIEKKPRLGLKLLLTGGTRCNLTNLSMTKQRLVELFGSNGKFLFSSFSGFGVAETLEYFSEQGLAYKEEDNGCVFTKNDQAQDILSMFENILTKKNVKILKNVPVKELIHKDKKITSIVLADQTITADKVIVCTGGLSYPATGSAGDGYVWAAALGHRIVPTRPALAPVYVSDPWIQELAGTSFPEAKIALYHHGKKLNEYTGPLLFTDRGLSGPLIHGLSRQIGDLLTTGSVSIGLDLLPEYSQEELDKKLQTELSINNFIKNYLEMFVSSRMAGVILTLSGIIPTKQCNSVTKEERKIIVKLLKNFSCQVSEVAGYDKAMITSGGIALDQVDSKTMRSKLIENLYFAGEILDLDGPSGGYNLQVCWTTGYTAGHYIGGGDAPPLSK